MNATACCCKYRTAEYYNCIYADNMGRGGGGSQQVVLNRVVRGDLTVVSTLPLWPQQLRFEFESRQGPAWA